jgi:hypothetical protein
MRDPQTDDELIVAEAAAMTGLLMAAAAQYGIMPTQNIDVARCEALIRKSHAGHLDEDDQRIIDDLKRGRIKGA